MQEARDRALRYFIEIDVDTLELIRIGYDEIRNLDKGRQSNPGIHRLFVSKGQYNKLATRSEGRVQSVVDA